MDDDEGHSMNEDLRLCGLPGDDVIDVDPEADQVERMGSASVPIDVGEAEDEAAGGAAAGAAGGAEGATGGAAAGAAGSSDKRKRNATSEV